MPYEEVLGHWIFYRQQGEAGPAVVFLHGTPARSQQWRPVQNTFGNDVRSSTR